VHQIPVYSLIKCYIPTEIWFHGKLPRAESPRPLFGEKFGKALFVEQDGGKFLSSFFSPSNVNLARYIFGAFLSILLTITDWKYNRFISKHRVYWNWHVLIEYLFIHKFVIYNNTRDIVGHNSPDSFVF